MSEAVKPERVYVWMLEYDMGDAWTPLEVFATQDEAEEARGEKVSPVEWRTSEYIAVPGNDHARVLGLVLP